MFLLQSPIYADAFIHSQELGVLRNPLMCGLTHKITSWRFTVEDNDSLLPWLVREWERGNEGEKTSWVLWSSAEILRHERALANSKKHGKDVVKITQCIMFSFSPSQLHIWHNVSCSVGEKNVYKTPAMH